MFQVSSFQERNMILELFIIMSMTVDNEHDGNGAVLRYAKRFFHRIAESAAYLLLGRREGGGIERCAREFRRVSGTSCIVYLAPFTRLLAGIDYLAITVFRIVRGHSCFLRLVPFSPFLSPVMAPAPRCLSPRICPSLSLSLVLSRFGLELLRALRSTRSLQEFFAQQRAYRYGIMQR